MNQQSTKFSGEKEWHHKLLLLMSAFLVFETITGLSIYFLPFSFSNQVMVLMHSLVGVVFSVIFLVY